MLKFILFRPWYERKKQLIPFPLWVNHADQLEEQDWHMLTSVRQTKPHKNQVLLYRALTVWTVAFQGVDRPLMAGAGRRASRKWWLSREAWIDGKVWKDHEEKKWDGGEGQHRRYKRWREERTGSHWRWEETGLLKPTTKNLKCQEEGFDIHAEGNGSPAYKCTMCLHDQYFRGKQAEWGKRLGQEGRHTGCNNQDLRAQVVLRSQWGPWA